jgi:hypothetical protein
VKIPLDFAPRTQTYKRRYHGDLRRTVKASMMSEPFTYGPRNEKNAPPGWFLIDTGYITYALPPEIFHSVYELVDASS